VFFVGGGFLKRFTETTKWDDPWYRKLKPRYKCFFNFLCDKCDCAGVWVVDMELAATFVGDKLDHDQCLAVFDGRVVDIGGGKWLLTGFIPFQYGELSRECKPHRPIFAAISKHGLALNCKGYGKGINTLPEKGKPTLQDKEKEKVQEKELLIEVSVEPPKDPSSELKAYAVLVLTYLNEKAGRHFDASKEVNQGPVIARLCEGNAVEEIKKMIDRQVVKWKGTHMEDYLQPATLFAKSNFQKYYDDRNAPIFRDQNTTKPNPRNLGFSKTDAELGAEYAAALKGGGKSHA
jgi:uncharacterized phage protein (TIGR02220 family)